MTTQWSTIFAPVLGQGRQEREGQTRLGQEMINVIENGGSLICEASTGTGKSFALLVPMIHVVQQHKAKKQFYKCVVSTETITLQTQLIDKDLPFLSTLYNGFTYRKLMGRSNYVCFDAASLASRGNMEINSMVEKLKMRQSNLGDGELADVERVLGKAITPEQWEYLVGSSKFCSDNQCTKDKCYSTRARELAMIADIVVINHALLATDIEMKVTGGGGAFSDGLLGPINVLAVDEGHKLQDVLTDQWTKTITDWELQEMSTSVMTGIDMGRTVVSNHSIGDQTLMALDGVQEMMNNIQDFYFLLSQKEGVQWKDYETALCSKYLTGKLTPAMSAKMTEFDEENPKRLAKAEKALEKAISYLGLAKEEAIDQQIKGLRKINKGLRSAKDLLEAVRIISKALETRDGIVQQYGVFGATVQGWERRRDGSRGMSLVLKPMDVSHRAKAIWAGVKTNVLVSATLTDLTEGSFRFVKTALAFPEGKEMIVGTPFELAKQQLVYVTTAQGETVEGAQYNFDELVDLMKATKGRALVLFTSRKELDWAAQELLQLQARDRNAFPYRIFVQEKDINKTKLATDFKNDTHSVLLATKSFFTGFDAPGETVTLVAIAKWPLPRYSVSCRQQINYWGKRGFPNWYEMLSLTDMLQGGGRLVRSTDCKGVIAILDFRATDTKNKVFKTASTGVSALGSPVTRSIEDVRQFTNA